VARLLVARLAVVPDRPLSLAVLAVVAICLVPNTLRARDFKDDRTLWTRELALDAYNPVALDWLSGELARAGHAHEAAKLLARSSDERSRRYFLLAGINGDSGRHVRRVVLTAAVTPDGDARTLRLLAEELESFDRGAPSGHLSTVRALPLGRERGQALTARQMNDRGRDALEAELATLSSRLGRHEDAKSWLQRVDRQHPEYLPSPLNLVLAQARTGDYTSAFATLQQLGEAKRSSVGLDQGTLERLGRRLLKSQALLDASLQAADERKPMLRALATLELGNFLIACRQLRPLYLADPTRAEVAQLYTQALVSARLDAEAERVASRALGPEQAAQVLTSLRRSLPAIQQDLPAAPDTDAWWREP
jgi:tetratricopeptide (TPR) repeat protein